MGLDMMYRTCTVQVNLDFAAEADMVQQDARLAGAAADRHRAVRQFAFHRRPAQRLPVAGAPRSGATPTTSAPACCPSPSSPAFGFERYVDWALDVPMYFVMRGGPYHDVAGASLPPPHGRAAARSCRASAPTISRLGQPSVDAVPRGAAEALSSKCAAPMAGRGAHLRAAGLLGRAALRRRRARRRLGPGQGLDGRGAPGACATRSPPALQHAVPHQHRQASPGRSSPIARAGLEARNFQDWEGRTEAYFLDHLDADRRLAATNRRRRAAGPLSRCMGQGDRSRLPTTPTEAGQSSPGFGEGAGGGQGQ